MSARLLLFLVLLLLSPARADELFVTNNSDSGTGSLREALDLAEDGDTIRFNAGLAGQTIALTTQLEISDIGVTIDATDVPGGVTVSGEGVTRVFFVSTGVKTVVMKRLHITRGQAPNVAVSDRAGGGIMQFSGELILEECSLIDNAAGSPPSTTTQTRGGDGGGIYSSGNLTILRSTISGNRAGKGNSGNTDLTIGSGGDGGGIRGTGNTLIRNSTIHGNRAGDGGDLNGSAGGAGGNGGGIFQIGPNVLTIENSTVTDNSAGNAAAGNNSVPGGSGGGIRCDTSATLDLENSIVTGNALGTGGFGPGSGPDINSTTGVTATGINMIGDNKTVKGDFPNPGVVGEPNANGDFVGSAQDPFDPGLGPLRNNGGPTPTRIPLPGSRAVNPPGGVATSPLATDQRGSARVVAGVLDIGAVEAPDYAALAAARAAEQASVRKKLNKLKKKLKNASRKKQKAKAKKLRKQQRKLKRRLRTLS